VPLPTCPLRAAIALVAALLGVALLFFALNLLTMTRTGINLGDNEQIAINSAG
jgi:hypothetical protein